MVKQWKKSLEQSDILSDGTPFDGANIDQPISEAGATDIFTSDPDVIDAINTETITPVESEEDEVDVIVVSGSGATNNKITSITVEFSPDNDSESYQVGLELSVVCDGTRSDILFFNDDLYGTTSGFQSETIEDIDVSPLMSYQSELKIKATLNWPFLGSEHGDFNITLNVDKQRVILV